MTWWRRGKRKPSSETLEAQAALATSRRRLDEAHAQGPAVRSLVEDLRRIRERNNFAPMIAAAFKEHR